MKKLFAISLILTLFVQAIPVLDFFCGKDTVVYAYVDEDKPEETKAKEKKSCKEFISLAIEAVQLASTSGQYSRIKVSKLPSPHSDLLTPPPDRSC